MVIDPDADGDELDNFIRNMLRDTLIAMRRQGAFSKLLMADDCLLFVGGAHTNYYWRSRDGIAQAEHTG